MALPEVIKAAMDQLQSVARTQTVVGEPITAGSVTLIPVSRVSVGFAAGGGGGDSKASGAGTGGGVTITPVAFISVNDGAVHVHTFDRSELDLGKLLSMAPELVGKLAKWIDGGRATPQAAQSEPK